MKPGYKTTEFLLTLVVILAGLVGPQLVGADATETIIGLVVAGAAALGYTVQRTAAKKTSNPLGESLSPETLSTIVKNVQAAVDMFEETRTPQPGLLVTAPTPPEDFTWACCGDFEQDCLHREIITKGHGTCQWLRTDPTGVTICYKPAGTGPTCAACARAPRNGGQCADAPSTHPEDCLLFKAIP